MTVPTGEVPSSYVDVRLVDEGARAYGFVSICPVTSGRVLVSYVGAELDPPYGSFMNFALLDGLIIVDELTDLFPFGGSYDWENNYGMTMCSAGNDRFVVSQTLFDANGETDGMGTLFMLVEVTGSSIAVVDELWAESDANAPTNYREFDVVLSWDDTKVLIVSFDGMTVLHTAGGVLTLGAYTATVESQGTPQAGGDGTVGVIVNGEFDRVSSFTVVDDQVEEGPLLDVSSEVFTLYGATGEIHGRGDGTGIFYVRAALETPWPVLYVEVEATESGCEVLGFGSPVPPDGSPTFGWANDSSEYGDGVYHLTWGAVSITNDQNSEFGSQTVFGFDAASQSPAIQTALMDGHPDFYQFEQSITVSDGRIYAVVYGSDLDFYPPTEENPYGADRDAVIVVMPTLGLPDLDGELTEQRRKFWRPRPGW